MKKVLVIRNQELNIGLVTDAMIDQMKNEVSKVCKSDDIEVLLVEHLPCDSKVYLLIKYIRNAEKFADALYFANGWASCPVCVCMFEMIEGFWTTHDIYYAPENDPGVGPMDDFDDLRQ